MENWVAIGLKPEEEFESADKGPEIIVPLDLLKRVECEAAKNLESWQWVDIKSKLLEFLLLELLSGWRYFRCHPLVCVHLKGVIIVFMAVVWPKIKLGFSSEANWLFPRRPVLIPY